jgi:hypothetical protein
MRVPGPLWTLPPITGSRAMWWQQSSHILESDPLPFSFNISPHSGIIAGNAPYYLVERSGTAPICSPSSSGPHQGEGRARRPALSAPLPGSRMTWSLERTAGGLSSEGLINAVRNPVPNGTPRSRLKRSSTPAFSTSD